MKRQFTDILYFDTKTDGLEWLGYRDKLKANGYLLYESSAMCIAKKIYPQFEIESIDEILGEEE